MSENRLGMPSNMAVVCLFLGCLMFAYAVPGFAFGETRQSDFQPPVPNNISEAEFKASLGNTENPGLATHSAGESGPFAATSPLTAAEPAAVAAYVNEAGAFGESRTGPDLFVEGAAFNASNQEKINNDPPIQGSVVPPTIEEMKQLILDSNQNLPQEDGEEVGLMKKVNGVDMEIRVRGVYELGFVRIYEWIDLENAPDQSHYDVERLSTDSCEGDDCHENRNIDAWIGFNDTDPITGDFVFSQEVREYVSSTRDELLAYADQMDNFPMRSLLETPKWFDRIYFMPQNEQAFHGGGTAIPDGIMIHMGTLEWAMSGDVAGERIFKGTVIHEMFHQWHTLEGSSRDRYKEDPTGFSEEFATVQDTADFFGDTLHYYTTPEGVQYPFGVMIVVREEDGLIDLGMNGRGEMGVRIFLDTEPVIPTSVVIEATIEELEALRSSHQGHPELLAVLETEIAKKKEELEDALAQETAEKLLDRTTISGDEFAKEKENPYAVPYSFPYKTYEQFISEEPATGQVQLLAETIKLGRSIDQERFDGLLDNIDHIVFDQVWTDFPDFIAPSFASKQYNIFTTYNPDTAKDPELKAVEFLGLIGHEGQHLRDQRLGTFNDSPYQDYQHYAQWEETAFMESQYFTQHYMKEHNREGYNWFGYIADHIRDGINPGDNDYSGQAARLVTGGRNDDAALYEAVFNPYQQALAHLKDTYGFGVSDVLYESSAFIHHADYGDGYDFRFTDNDNKTYQYFIPKNLNIP